VRFFPGSVDILTSFCGLLSCSVFAISSPSEETAVGPGGVVLKPGQRFGFHNLRHSLATFLVNKEQDTKTVQGLLRHANVSTTLGLYAQSVNSSMVEAQESMLKAILRNGSNTVN
jgi:integrase